MLSGKQEGYRNALFSSLAVSFARNGQKMALTFVKIALGAGIAILTLGVFPDRLRGGILAIAICVVAAVIIHFVAP
jgi:hypothetical protein